jgi:uncharacterized protein YcfJ
MQNTYPRWTLHLIAASAVFSVGAAYAQEMAKVISAVPIVQPVANTQAVCQNGTTLVPGQKSGAGALMGAIAGGALGNATGSGGGRALATGLGVVLGAGIGDNIEGAGPAQVVPTQTCTNQTTYNNQITGYRVTYEFPINSGKRYEVQSPTDPGAYLPINITPQISGGITTTASPVVAAPVVVPHVQAPVWVQPTTVVTTPPVVYQTPVYPMAYPNYSAYPAYGGPPIQLGLHYGGRYGGGWGHRHGWRY